MLKHYEVKFYFKGSGETDIFDLTEIFEKSLSESKIENGVAVLFVPGSTAAITTIEYEGGVLNDLKRAIERIAPRNIHYDHDSRWGDGNGYSHVRASLLGPSLAVPVTRGKPLLGTWQQPVLIDFDNRPRNREVVITIFGE